MKEVRGEIRHLASPFTLFLPPPTWLRNTLQLECCQSPYGRNVLIETPLLGLNTFMGPDVEGHEVDKKKSTDQEKGSKLSAASSENYCFSNLHGAVPVYLSEKGGWQAGTDMNN